MQEVSVEADIGEYIFSAIVIDACCQAYASPYRFRFFERL